MEGKRFSASTARNRKISIFNVIFERLYRKRLFSFLAFLFLVIPKQSHSLLLDRTVAIVGKRVLTYREVEKMYITGRILDGFRVRLYRSKMSSEEFKIAKDKAIETLLVRSYLDRIALKGSLREEVVNRGVERIRKYFSDSGKFKYFQKFYEIDIAEIKDIIGDKLALDNFFARLVIKIDPVTDAEAEAYYRQQKDEKFFGKSFEELKEHIKKYLQNQRIRRSRDEWVREQTKRAGVRLIK